MTKFVAYAETDYFEEYDTFDAALQHCARDAGFQGEDARQGYVLQVEDGIVTKSWMHVVTDDYDNEGEESTDYVGESEDDLA